MTESCCLQVPAHYISMRLDRFLDDNLPEFSRSQIKRLIDDAAVTVNGVKSKPGVKLKGGEQVCVLLPKPVAFSAEAEAIPLQILYEDRYLIVVNKPAHLVVHPAPGHQSGTLVNALLHHCTDLSGVGGKLRPGIVHRLDKGTSGVMVATKDDQTHRFLAGQFKAHTIKRRYRALVYGVMQEKEGTIDLPVGRHPVHRKKMSTQARHSRRAITHWKVRRCFEEDRMTLVDLHLETGRTHQIRVHLAEMQHPVIGDPLYGGLRRVKSILDSKLGALVAGLQRQFLHAWQLGFEHPNGQLMLFQVGLPGELCRIVDYLKFKYNDLLTDIEIPTLAGPVDAVTNENS